MTKDYVFKFTVFFNLYLFLWQHLLTSSVRLFNVVLRSVQTVLSNCSENIHNVIQMALKWLFFSEKLQELPSGWRLCPQTPI